MHLKLISCEVIFREMCDAVARSPHQVDVQFLPKGLHDLGAPAMRESLELAVSQTDPSLYDAILMGYGLCGNGLSGLRARAIPLVVPRAHDCIALLFGSRQRYREYFDRNPGVYFLSTGWLERGQSLAQLAQVRTGIGSTLDELIAKYGEDNGRYLYEEIYRYEQSYRQLTYIQTGLEPDGTFERRAQDHAARKGWEFSKIGGDLNLFQRLVAGDWNPADFLVVEPGFEVVARYDDGVIASRRSVT
jgi:hypothetical protein